MRELIEARVRSVWCEDMEVDFDMSLDELPELSDKELLDIYDLITGING